MAVLLKDLITEANSLADDTFSNTDWVAWFNACLLDLAPLIKQEDILDGSAWVQSGNAYCMLPTNLMEIKLVKLNGAILTRKSVDSLDDGYYIYGGKLFFTNPPQSITSLQIFVVRAPKTLTTASTEVEIPDVFSYLLPTFAAYKSQLKEDEPERAEAFFSEYQRGKQELGDYMKNSRQSAIVNNYQWAVIR